ncbi:MAG: hypothetical protein U9R28_10280 [Pseudomonadota bacterium]|nr:hypothetical protein [Pseudomonadota bacterium]
MKKPLSLLATSFAITVLTSQTVLAADDHPGKAFHDQADCMKCHAAQPYDPKKSDSFPKLVKAVQFCNDNLNTGFWEDEVAQLADYLNQEYYHHPK